MIITLAEFCNERDLQIQSVLKYIRGHEEVQNCIVNKSRGTVTTIDTLSPGFALLEKKYPKKNIIEVVEDAELKEELTLAKGKIEALVEQLTIKDQELKKMYYIEAENACNSKELERKEREIKDKDIKLQTLMSDYNELKIELAKKEIELKNELEYEKNRFEKSLFGWKKKY